MWRNYLVVALRAGAKNKTFVLLNLFGLVIGLTSALLLLLYVNHERSFDAWLPDGDRLYQMETVFRSPTSTQAEDSLVPPRPAVAALTKDFAQLEGVTSVYLDQATVLRDGKPLSTDMMVADANFFRLFDLPFLRGSAGGALADLSAVVLTESEARRLFGGIEVLGRIVTQVRRSGETRDLRVSGVLRDLPSNSHLSFKMMRPVDLSAYAAQPELLTNWGDLHGYVYLKLRPGTDIAAINAAMPAFERRNITGTTGDGFDMDRELDFKFVPVRDIHLHHAHQGAMRPGGDVTAVYTFSAIAVLILAIACINFVNLATARASQRAREVGIRKVLGARRGQLIAQFLGESTLLVVLAMLISLVIVELFLPAFATVVGAELSLDYFGTGGIALPILALLVAVGAAGGLYPAFYLARFRPAVVLRATAGADPRGSGRIRNALVIAQFTVSIALMICTSVVYAQTLYARSSDPGYRRDGLLAAGNFDRRPVAAAADTLRHEFGLVEGVLSLARSSSIPASPNEATMPVRRPGGETAFIPWWSIDAGFFDTMGIAIRAGRGLSGSVAMDDVTIGEAPAPLADEASLLRRGANIVVNERAARQLGFASPQAAVGEQVDAGLVAPELGMVRATVVGVAADARFRSLRDPPKPMIYFQDRRSYRHLLVRHASSEPAAVQARLERIWRRVVPDTPFESAFVVDEVSALYDGEEALGEVLGAFAGLSIFVACLGLYGLAAFTASRRTREIGVRKVFGAHTSDIVRLLLWQFTRPVVLANFLAWPIAWWLMRGWLNGFSDRIGLHLGWFLGAGLLAVLVAAATIAGHALRVARRRPVEALRYE
jgi:putative ABC transport system permease protein